MFSWDPPAELPDPQTRGNPHHHLEYSWTLLWYASLDADHLREAQEIDQLRRQESDGWRTITSFEREADYQEGELRRDIEHAGLFNVRSVLEYVLESICSLPRTSPQDGTTYNGKYLRELMSPEEKLFELHRIHNLPRISQRRHCLNVLRELDNSATLSFHRNRAGIKLVSMGDKSLCISRRKGKELSAKLDQLIQAQSAQTFSVRITTSWQQREIQRRVTELRNQSLQYQSTGRRYYLYPNYIIDSKLVLEPQQPLKLPTAPYEELIEQAAAFLSRVEGKITCRPDVQIRVQDLRKRRTLEERAFEQYLRNTGGGSPTSGAEETAILVAMRLTREGHEIPFLQPHAVLARSCQIRESLQETIRKAHVSHRLQNRTNWNPGSPPSKDPSSPLLGMPQPSVARHESPTIGK